MVIDKPLISYNKGKYPFLFHFLFYEIKLHYLSPVFQFYFHQSRGAEKLQTLLVILGLFTV